MIDLSLKTKDEAAALLGKPSFWFPKRTVNLSNYLAGIPEMEDKITLGARIDTDILADFVIYPRA